MRAWRGQVINPLPAYLWLIMGLLGPWPIPVVTSLSPDVQWEKIHFVIWHNPHIGSFALGLRPIIVGRTNGSSEPCNPFPSPSQDNKSKPKSHPSHTDKLKDAEVMSPSYLYLLHQSDPWKNQREAGKWLQTHEATDQRKENQIQFTSICNGQ